MVIRLPENKTEELLNQIISHPQYLIDYKKIENHEVTRIFCHHDMSHFLDVARIAEILNQKEDLQIPRYLLYGAALLHDIGRFEQYENNIPHAQASARIAPAILKDCGFVQEDIDLIVDAIANHGNSSIRDEASLRGILYRADKMSRPCFYCKASDECNWKDDKKNLTLQY